MSIYLYMSNYLTYICGYKTLLFQTKVSEKPQTRKSVMENTTKMVQVETVVKMKGSDNLMNSLPKSFVRIASEITGYSETHISDLLRGKKYPKNNDFLEASVRIADFHIEFEERMKELLKPFENAKLNENRI